MTDSEKYVVKLNNTCVCCHVITYTAYLTVYVIFYWSPVEMKAIILISNPYEAAKTALRNSIYIILCEMPLYKQCSNLSALAHNFLTENVSCEATACVIRLLIDGNITIKIKIFVCLHSLDWT